MDSGEKTSDDLEWLSGNSNETREKQLLGCSEGLLKFHAGNSSKTLLTLKPEAIFCYT